LGDVVDLKRTFLQILIASLVATAALAIGFLLLAEFNDRAWKVIRTTALLSGFSLLGLPGAALLDQGRAVARTSGTGATLRTPSPWRSPSSKAPAAAS